MNSIFHKDDADELEVIFTSEEIAARIAVIAREIADCRFEQLLVISILKGSFIFAADLIRALHGAGLSPEVDFISLSSYRDKTFSAGLVEIVRDIESTMSGRDILIVDDILESGRTLAFAKDLAVARGARTIKTCVLLDKNVSRAVSIEADFSAFGCPNMFVVGYGMDLAHRFRELPFVGRLINR